MQQTALGQYGSLLLSLSLSLSLCVSMSRLCLGLSCLGRLGCLGLSLGLCLGLRLGLCLRLGLRLGLGLGLGLSYLRLGLGYSLRLLLLLGMDGCGLLLLKHEDSHVWIEGQTDLSCCRHLSLQNGKILRICDGHLL